MQAPRDVQPDRRHGEVPAVGGPVEEDERAVADCEEELLFIIHNR